MFLHNSGVLLIYIEVILTLYTGWGSFEIWIYSKLTSAGVYAGGIVTALLFGTADVNVIVNAHSDPPHLLQITFSTSECHFGNILK